MVLNRVPPIWIGTRWPPPGHPGRQPVVEQIEQPLRNLMLRRGKVHPLGALCEVFRDLSMYFSDPIGDLISSVKANVVSLTRDSDQMAAGRS